MSTEEPDLPRVAVCMAAHKGAAYIDEQIDSIVLQQGAHVVIHVSIDPSPDETETILRRRAEQDPRIVLLPCGPRFGGAAPNFFRLLADVDFDAVDYVAFADQDDVWHVDKLQRAIGAIRARGLAGYSSNVTAFWPDGRERLVHKARPQRRWDFFFESAGPGCTYVMTAALARSLQQCLRAEPEARTRIVYHDWFVYAFARARGLSWFIDPVPGMRYRQHATNQLGANAGLRPAWNRLRLVFNGWAFGQTLLIAQVGGLDLQSPVLREVRGGRLGLLRLALRAWQCRRAPRDRLAFFVGCLWLALRPTAPRWVDACAGKGG